jgi:preprotein translocase subunit SecA
MLSKKYGIMHEVLNAKQHEREAQIILLAGQQHKNPHGEMAGNVTIATNMAGRGTDIKLTPAPMAAGGLHVIGTERHTARRIDNQLRGRSGRQGDPGSSRFYSSLQDDLMKLFAGDWVIKALGWLGMEEGMAIEDKRISKAILRAQKKVEERNFTQRKQLLDYDEVMDHQRTTFYGMRQRVLQSKGVDEIIWNMIGESIVDAVEKFITQDYVATSVSEWAWTNLDVLIEPADLHGMRSMDQLENYVKSQSRAEAETHITATLGEFVGEDAQDRSTWDTKGLQNWAMSRFRVNLSQSAMRTMSNEEVERKLRTAAAEQIDHRDCSGLVKYLEADFPEKELCKWALEKFGIAIVPEDMMIDTKSRARKTADEVAELIEARARAAYARREIDYPVEHALTYAYGGDQGSTDNPYSAEFLHDWAKKKFNIELTPQQIRTSTVPQLRHFLTEQQALFMTGGALEKAVDYLITAHPDREELRNAFNERFMTKLKTKDLQIRAEDQEEDGAVVMVPASPEQLREMLLGRARNHLRHELSELEQWVLIKIFDQSWKDHLYAMDLLKAGIGLVAFAEQDPRIKYKKEGFKFFQQMLAEVRDKVTDLIFRARVVGSAQARSMYKETAAVHETSGGYGVGENVAATAAATATAAAPAAAAQQTSGGEPVKVKQIVRETKKVGRNDPCPCGSGKKYKKCHGVGVA